jgi:hypothetical protein
VLHRLSFPGRHRVRARRPWHRPRWRLRPEGSPGGGRWSRHAKRWLRTAGGRPATPRPGPVRGNHLRQRWRITEVAPDAKRNDRIPPGCRAIPGTFKWPPRAGEMCHPRRRRPALPQVMSWTADASRRAVLIGVADKTLIPGASVAMRDLLVTVGVIMDLPRLEPFCSAGSARAACLPPRLRR